MFSPQNTRYEDGLNLDKGADSANQSEDVDEAEKPVTSAQSMRDGEYGHTGSKPTAISQDIKNAAKDDLGSIMSHKGKNGQVDSIYPPNSLAIGGPVVSEPGNNQDSTNVTSLTNRLATGYSGSYMILELIGSGGSGDVYKSRIESVNTENPLNLLQVKRPTEIFACKILLDRLLDNKEHYKRFQQEARLVKRLSHPNIVNVHDAGAVGGRPFMILDYLEGEALSNTYDTTKGLSIHRALPIFLQISDAFDHAHMRGVVHRDLKPSNIMLTMGKDGKDFVKVVDFGIAKIISETTLGSTKLTKTGQVFGTPVYMSPEQCRGEAIDSASDIYSFGILMYEVLTGRPPFEGADYWSLLYKHTHETPKSIKDIDPDIRLVQKVEFIIFRCLEKLPDARYKNMNEVRVELEAAIASGGSGSRLIAKFNQSFGQISRRVNVSLSKPLSTRQWLLVAIVAVSVGIGITMVVRNQLELAEIKSFLRGTSDVQRTIDWKEPDAPAYARDSRLFHEMENEHMEQEKLIRAFGGMQTEGNFDYMVKLGNFYLSAGSYVLADKVFDLAEKLADSLKLADFRESYDKVANLELSRAKCAFSRSNYEDCIKRASKSIKLHETYRRDRDNDFFCIGSNPCLGINWQNCVGTTQLAVGKQSILVCL